MSSNGRGNAVQPGAKTSRPSAGKGLQNFFLILMFTSIPSATLILGLVLSHGSTAFHLSDLRNGYHPGPEGRGTLSLVWSCVSTIFTLVYVSVHPDIPNDEKEDRPNEHPAKGLFGCADKFHTVARSLRRLLSLVFWPLMNIFAPSLIVLVASMEYQSARAGVESMKKLSGGQSRWTTRHAFFADMGGFELNHKPLLTGREFYEYFEENKPKLDYEKIQEEIRDRSATSTVFKILTFLQASWFIAQSIVRGVERRAISQLEVTTCAYIFSLMVAYLFWIRKPYRVSGRIPLEQHIFLDKQADMQQRSGDILQRTSPSSSADSTSQTRRRHSANPGSARDYNNAEEGGLPPQENPARPPFNGGPSSFGKSLDDIAEQSTLPFESNPTPHSNAKPSGPTFRDARFTPFNRATYHSDEAWALSCLTSGIVCALIGLIHLLPFWDRDYANPMGKILWRVCGTVQIILSVGLAISAVIERINMPKCLLWPLWIVMAVMAFAYCISRFVIFVLIWYSFSSLPPAVYDSIDWSWIPHWY